MRVCRMLIGLALLIGSLAVDGTFMGQANVTTYKNNNSRTGIYISGGQLTPEDVSASKFGKIFSVPVDGQVYAQPLYIAAVKNIHGGTHNVIYVATESDSLYAIDADNGSVLWQHPDPATDRPLAPVPFTAVGNPGGCADLQPNIGITGTPVIDTGTNSIFFITKEMGAPVVQRLHAVDLSSGKEKFGGPVMIAAAVRGHGDGSVNSNIVFNARDELNRPGLTLSNGHIIAAWGGHCDAKAYHGWVMAFDAKTLKREAVFMTTPNGKKAGVWMAGDGIAVDSAGYFYLVTGNGDYDGTSANDYGDSIVKLALARNSFKIVDWFTPGVQQDLNKNDDDLGSGGLILLPDLPDSVKHKHLLAQMGKDEIIRLVDRDNMGKYCGSDNCPDTQIVQEIHNVTDADGDDAGGIWGSPTYWNGTVYWAGGLSADAVKGWALNATNNAGLLSPSPTLSTSITFSNYSSGPVISADGNTNGILWILDNSGYCHSHGPQVLYAFDASDLGKMLYNSSQAGGGRDTGAPAVKFTVPMIANGKVYAGGDKAVTAWGIIDSH